MCVFAALWIASVHLLLLTVVHQCTYCICLQLYGMCAALGRVPSPETRLVYEPTNTRLYMTVQEQNNTHSLPSPDLQCVRERRGVSSGLRYWSRCQRRHISASAPLHRYANGSPQNAERWISFNVFLSAPHLFLHSPSLSVHFSSVVLFLPLLLSLLFSIWS